MAHISVPISEVHFTTGVSTAGASAAGVTTLRRRGP
jgi:hypothetical protein